MHKQFFANKASQAILALLAISTIGLAVSPAKADDALIQETIQRSVTTGSDNLSVQSSSQHNRQSNTVRDRHNYKNNSNAGVVQRTEQSCDQFGEFNTCVQDSRQSNASHNRRA